jgi:hypothetical protein
MVVSPGQNCRDPYIDVELSVRNPYLAKIFNGETAMTILHLEQWRPVVGHPGYEVSDLGRVRSLDRIVEAKGATGGPRRYKGQMLNPGPSNFGHLSVVLGRHKTRMVHTLVLEAFVGPRPKGMDGCHGPGGTQDNRLENLRWDTRSNNILDGVRAGTWFSAARVKHNKKMAEIGRKNFLRINAGRRK